MELVTRTQGTQVQEQRATKPESAAALREQVMAIIDETGTSEAHLIPILQRIQEVYRYLPEEALECVAERLGISAATVFGVATFYAQFSLSPKGRWIIRVCDGTACHVRGSRDVLNAIHKKLHLNDGQTTTGDGLFSVEIVSCIGACGLAPVVTVDGKVHGQVTPAELTAVLDELKASAEGETNNAAAEVD